ncbi:probable L-gulonolactone oxidase 6 [Bradysia coprophila]|uniref:probable L-gulonolactone oxidase 6 n=1 Tax=Bradysia coprophila TaxID=38358 RepID=UPI00187D7B71|nr:probable L-gulonolactone oxidase 6 [Bradysia coprophila]
MRIYSLILGLYFTLLPFVQCDTPPKSYTSYRPYPFCNPSDYMRYPSNSEDVVAIINEAIERKVTVKALGARHSQSDIICTEGIPVDMNKFKSCRMNDDGITATFGAGVTLQEAGAFLLQHGRALRTTPAYGKITLGGAIGTSAHGSSIKYNSSLSAQVVSLTVVNGLAQTLEISDPDDLKSFGAHLGLLGIIVDVTMYTVPLYKVLAHNYVMPDTILTDGTAQNWAQTSDQITYYWFPACNEVVVVNLTFVPVDTPGTAISYLVPSSYGFFNLIIARAKEMLYDLTVSECAAASTLGNNVLPVFELISLAHVVSQTPGLTPFYSENGIFVNNPAVGYPSDMLAAVCSEENAGLLGKACLWAHGDLKSNMTGLDNEIGIPLTNLEDLVLTVKDIQAKTPLVFPIDGLVMRFSGKSEIYMSTAHQRDTIHVEFVLVQRTDPYNDATGALAGYQTLLQAMAKNMSGRSHWGKSGTVYHSNEMLDLKLDPQARKNFIAAMKKFDPKGIFLNNFGRRLLGTGTRIDADPKTIHCALLDNCFCSEDSDCVESQSCTSLPGYENYPVCKTRNEVPIIFEKNRFSGVNLLQYLSVTLPTLAAEAVTKCSVGSVIKTVTNVVGSLL